MVIAWGLQKKWGIKINFSEIINWAKVRRQKGNMVKKPQNNKM